MARRRKGRDVHGILVLDKPPGLSSNQAVQRVRHLLGARKAGHTGSLDPFATGMLPVCFGEASKTSSFLLDAHKTYLATARLGIATSTGDVEGEVTQVESIPDFEAHQISQVLHGFSGRISQVPPMYSALKHQGQPLYKLAREGRSVHREPREITIHAIRLVSYAPPLITFEVRCSKGTYIRTLAEDIAIRLGTRAHLQQLRRLGVEPFAPRDMVGLEQVEEAVAEGNAASLLLPLDAGLAGWPVVRLDSNLAAHFCRGQAVPGGDGMGLARVYGPQGSIIGLGEMQEQGRLQPKRVFVFTEEAL